MTADRVLPYFPPGTDRSAMFPPGVRARTPLAIDALHAIDQRDRLDDDELYLLALTYLIADDDGLVDEDEILRANANPALVARARGIQARVEMMRH